MEALARIPEQDVSVDNRAFSRMEVDFPAIVRQQGTDQVTEAIVRDLSGNGLRMALSAAHDIGSQLSVLMQFGGDTIVTTAEVVWARPCQESNTFEVACQFVD